MPYATDNALVKTAEIVRRLVDFEAIPRLDEMFADRVGALGLSPEVQKQLLDPGHVAEALAQLPPDLARNLHSCSHMTFSPNIMSSGEKGNTVPDKATLRIDIRILPGETQDDVDHHLREIIGPDLLPSVEIHWLRPDMPDGTPFSSTDTPMWSALSDAIQMAYPDAKVVPSLVTGAGLLSNKVPLAEFLNRFHGHNERIDVESLRLTTQLWLNVFDRLRV
jgi:acetylornithine deacetylase/succinyl-diaminopimelate desuccinylase-like protein